MDKTYLGYLTTKRRKDMLFINRSKINSMKKNIIDEELGITEFDIFESEHEYEDWQIIEDVK